MEDKYAPVFVISIAAELAQMHPQTLRQYDRLGLVTPSRAPGRSRTYSRRDVEALKEIQQLSQEGVSLEGIRRILELENQVAQLQRKLSELSEVVRRGDRDSEARVFAASIQGGDTVTLSRGERPQARSAAVVLWRPKKPGHRSY